MLFKDPIFGDCEIDESAFVHPKAEAVGDVIICENVHIAMGASIRGDESGTIYIGKGTNVQDQVTLHGLLNKYIEVNGREYSIFVGSHCSLAHCALIHGPCVIGKKSFVGPQSQVWVSNVGRNNYIGAQSLVKFAEIGAGCVIGDQACIKGLRADQPIRVPPGRYISDFVKINDQQMADNLPRVPDAVRELLEFNKEVVDVNKHLAKLHIVRKKVEHAKIAA